MKKPRSIARAMKRMRSTGKYVHADGTYAGRKENTVLRKKWIAFVKNQEKELENQNTEQNEKHN